MVSKHRWISLQSPKFIEIQFGAGRSFVETLFPLSTFHIKLMKHRCIASFQRTSSVRAKHPSLHKHSALARFPKNLGAKNNSRRNVSAPSVDKCRKTASGFSLGCEVLVLS